MSTRSTFADQTNLPALSTRDLRSFTAEAEKRILIALAERLPPWIGPDHLTALGVVSMFLAGLCYRFLPVTPLALLGVNLFLFLNWFGDSLDGTLARVREKQRPRYGFYVDHLVDAFGAIFLLGGLAASGLSSPSSALALLIAYLLLQIHIALKAHATSVFQIAFGGIGGTEARILLAGVESRTTDMARDSANGNAPGLALRRPSGRRGRGGRSGDRAHARPRGASFVEALMVLPAFALGPGVYWPLFSSCNTTFATARRVSKTPMPLDAQASTTASFLRQSTFFIASTGMAVGRSRLLN